MNITRLALTLATSLGLASYAMAEPTGDSREDVRMTMDVAKNKIRQATRGGLVYKTYCVLCHGSRGDGDARIGKLHSELNLRIRKRPADYYEKIIREGGPALGRSEFMPTWHDELSNEQISDVVVYLSLIIDPVKRGEVVFKTNCILCHGVNGDGKGRAAGLYNPPPANLTRSDKNDEYKRMIITLGGAAMGRSAVMPIWDEQLSPDDIDDVVSYLRTIVEAPPPL